MHAPKQPHMPPSNHACPPTTMHAPLQPCTSPQQPCMPSPQPHPHSHACPPGNHAHPPQPHNPPPQPCMPPNHAYPPQPRMPPWQSCMPPSVDRMTHTRKNITLPQTSFAGGNNLMNSSLLPYLLSANEVVERKCFHKCVSRILSTGGCIPPCTGADNPPKADTPFPLGRHPHPQQTATAADGTHPTGMHSRLNT